MKILHILADAEWGGGPRVVALLAEGLTARGHHVTVLMPRGPATESVAAAGAHVYETPLPQAQDARRLLSAVDVVHTHGKRAGLWRSQAHLLRRPVVHTHHGLHFRGLKGRLWLHVERWLGRYRTAATIHVAAHQTTRGVELGLPGETIPLGLDGERITAQALEAKAARAALDLARPFPQELLVGAVGRLDPVKRWDLVLRTLPEIREARLTFVGDGPDRARLERDSRFLGERVRFLGAVPYASRLLRVFDVLVLPSLEEGCPLIVLEAVALGVPILCSDIPAHRELLGQDPWQANTAWSLVAPDVGAWAHKLAWFARHREDAAVVADRQAAMLDRTQLSTVAMLDAHEALYRKVLS